MFLRGSWNRGRRRMRGCAQKDHRGWRSWRWTRSKWQDKFLCVTMHRELYFQTFFLQDRFAWKWRSRAIESRRWGPGQGKMTAEVPREGASVGRERVITNGMEFLGGDIVAEWCGWQCLELVLGTVSTQTLLSTPRATGRRGWCAFHWSHRQRPTSNGLLEAGQHHG